MTARATWLTAARAHGSPLVGVRRLRTAAGLPLDASGRAISRGSDRRPAWFPRPWLAADPGVIELEALSDAIAPLGVLTGARFREPEEATRELWDEFAARWGGCGAPEPARQGRIARLDDEAIQVIATPQGFAIGASADVMCLFKPLGEWEEYRFDDELRNRLRACRRELLARGVDGEAAYADYLPLNLHQVMNALSRERLSNMTIGGRE